MRKMKISAVFLTVFLIATVLIDSSSSKSCEDKKCIVKEPEPCAKKQKFEDFKVGFEISGLSHTLMVDYFRKDSRRPMNPQKLKKLQWKIFRKTML